MDCGTGDGKIDMEGAGEGESGSRNSVWVQSYTSYSGTLLVGNLSGAPGDG